MCIRDRSTAGFQLPDKHGLHKPLIAVMYSASRGKDEQDANETCSWGGLGQLVRTFLCMDNSVEDLDRVSGVTTARYSNGYTV